MDKSDKREVSMEAIAARGVKDTAIMAKIETARPEERTTPFIQLRISVFVRPKAVGVKKEGPRPVGCALVTLRLLVR